MNERLQLLILGLLETLQDMGTTPMRDASLRRQAALKIEPRPTTAELDEAIRHVDERRLAATVRDDVGLFWSLTAAGRIWLQTNG